MSELLLIIIIIALYTRLHQVKRERSQWKNTLLMKQKEANEHGIK